MVTRSSRSSRVGFFALGFAAVLGHSGAASGANIDPIAYGHQLAGGTLRVVWVPGPGAPTITTVAPIIVSGPNAGAAFLPDPFGNPNPGAIFRVAGDTFLADWTLQNLADAFIVEAVFDLAGSISVFDDSPISPDSPGSAAGLNGVSYNAALSTAPMQNLAFEFTPWLGLKNAGDLWMGQSIIWDAPTVAGGGFGTGQLYVWNDDTDVIPAPGAAGLLAIGGMMASRRRRHSSR